MQDAFTQAQETIRAAIEDDAFKKSFKEAFDVILKSLKEGHAILIAGNRGSAAEAQHFAAEIVGRYKLERRGYPAIALTTDSSALTAIGNDYGFDEIFARQIEALGVAGDVFVALSTSGNSMNVLRALESARKLGLATISLLGKDGGMVRGISDVDVIVPSIDTARIQELHLLTIHTWCELIEPHLS